MKIAVLPGNKQKTVRYLIEQFKNCTIALVIFHPTLAKTSKVSAVLIAAAVEKSCESYFCD